MRREKLRSAVAPHLDARSWRQGRGVEVGTIDGAQGGGKQRVADGEVDRERSEGEGERDFHKAGRGRPARPGGPSSTVKSDMDRTRNSSVAMVKDVNCWLTSIATKAPPIAPRASA